MRWRTPCAELRVRLRTAKLPAMRTRGIVVGLVVVAVACTAFSGARPAHADAPRTETAAPSGDLPAILARAAQYAARFEDMKKRGTFTLSGRMEELDGGGKVDGTKELVVRSIATPARRKTEIVRYLEDGTDKTAEARQKAEKRRAESKNEKKRDLHLPFLASEQGRYVFTLLERDAAVPSRVRVGFAPHVAAEDAFKGSAWLDDATGEVLTMGFSPTKTAMFVDHVDVTMRFDLATPLGRAPSNVSFEARGGLLFFRKRVRGSGTLSDPSVGF